jgi:hypothetical protein
VPLPDVWAEYHRLAKEEGWTQQRIADAKGVAQKQVSYRIKWHESLPETARKAVFDNILEEGHIEAVSDVVFDGEYLAPWLSISQAQTELVAEVLGKHRGTTAGIKPTVKVVREATPRIPHPYHPPALAPRRPPRSRPRVPTSRLPLAERGRR